MQEHDGGYLSFGLPFSLEKDAKLDEVGCADDANGHGRMLSGSRTDHGGLQNLFLAQTGMAVCSFLCLDADIHVVYGRMQPFADSGCHMGGSFLL